MGTVDVVDLLRTKLPPIETVVASLSEDFNILCSSSEVAYKYEENDCAVVYRFFYGPWIMEQPFSTDLLLPEEDKKSPLTARDIADVMYYHLKPNL